jgi:hypothetical protein
MDCQESLPPYQTPRTVYELVLRVDQPDPNRVERGLNEIQAGKGGIGFSMDLKNAFDETLAGAVADTLGEMQIWWKQDQEITATLIVTKDHEIVTDHIRWNDMVVFDPGDSIRFAVAWKWWQDDRGEWVWNYLKRIPAAEGSQVIPMAFLAQAKIQLFDKGPAVYSNIVEFRALFY